MGNLGLFDVLDLGVGDIISCTPGKDVDRVGYICGVMNELEGMGFVAEYREDGRDINFELLRRRKQNV